MEEIEQIKFFNSVKIGAQEIVSLNGAKCRAWIEDSHYIKLTDGEIVVYTTIYNTVWYRLKKDDIDVSKQTAIPSTDAVSSETSEKKNTRPKLSKTK